MSPAIPRIRALLFDLGGVIQRTEDPLPRARLAATFGLTGVELEELIYRTPHACETEVGLHTPQEHWQEVLAQLGQPPERLPEIIEGFWGGDIFDYALVDLLRQARRAGLRTGLLSNAWADLRERLEQKGILDAFDCVLVSGEIQARKPAPRAFELATARLGCPPAETVFVDDFIENIEAAAALGYQTIHFQTSAQAAAELKALLPEVFA